MTKEESRELFDCIANNDFESLAQLLKDGANAKMN